MKRYTFIILTLLIFICTLPVFGCNVENDNAAAQPNFNSETVEDTIPATDTAAFLYEEKDGGITLTGLNDDALTEIVVPSEINGKPVKEISENAFINRKNLRTLYIPKSVEKLGYGFLSGCSALSSVTLPFTGETPKKQAGVKDYNFGYIFGETPFNGAKDTMQFYHKDAMDYVEMVYNYIPSSLKTVKITGVKDTYIPYAAFYNCTDIDKIILGSEITGIGEFAFSGVVGKIIWENPKITTVGEHAFEDFKGEELIIPESIAEIKRSAYSACVNVKSFVIPDSVKKMDIYAFSYNYELQSVIIGKGIEKLPVETFYFCINLKNVTIPEGLKVIEDGAFDSCKALTAIEIPASVIRINANTFKNCGKLKTATFKDASGWRYYGILTSGDYFPSETVSNSSTAAKYLTDNFRDYIWEKLPQ